MNARIDPRTGETKRLGLKARKKIVRNKRAAVNYTEEKPDMCLNCVHYAPPIRSENGVCQARCVKHEFGVHEHAVCDSWEYKGRSPAEPSKGGDA